MTAFSPRWRRLAVPLGATLALVLWAGGCGSRVALPPLYKATGAVLSKDGTSLAGGTVRFTPVADTSFSVTGPIQGDGTFILHTIKGATKVSGAPEGEYRVTVLPPLRADQRPIVPIDLPETRRIEARDNHFSLEVSPAPGTP